MFLQAKSLLSSGLCECLVDPQLNEEYNKDEMEIMMCAARLCLSHSSSRRPTMKMVNFLFVFLGFSSSSLSCHIYDLDDGNLISSFLQFFKKDHLTFGRHAF